MKKLGFGTMRLPLLDSNDKKSIDFDQVSRMTDIFLEKGFTYFDTAYPYHDQASEIAVRECLVKRHPRDSFLLADKMPIIRVRKPEDYPMYFEEQLQKCGVDYFDYYLLHNIGVDRYDRTKATGGTKSGQYYERSRIGHGAAKDCLHCGLCEEICPQHIEIRSFLEKFMNAFADFEEKYSS